MCRFISFFVRPIEDLPVRVHDLTGHAETAQVLGLEDRPQCDGWREGHYLPDGTVAVSVLDGDTLSARQCESGVRARWPAFNDFFRWAVRETNLQTLYLWNTPVSDLTPLAGLAGLQTLDLSGTQVSDAEEKRFWRELKKRRKA